MEGNTDRQSSLVSEVRETMDVNAYPWTDLHVASKKGLVKAVRTLLEQGSDPDVLGLHIGEPGEAEEDGPRLRSPLHIAIEFDEVEVVQILLEHGADANVITHPEGWTALHMAASTKDMTPENSKQFGALLSCLEALLMWAKRSTLTADHREHSQSTSHGHEQNEIGRGKQDCKSPPSFSLDPDLRDHKDESAFDRFIRNVEYQSKRPDYERGGRLSCSPEDLVIYGNSFRLFLRLCGSKYLDLDYLLWHAERGSAIALSFLEELSFPRTTVPGELESSADERNYEVLLRLLDLNSLERKSQFRRVEEWCSAFQNYICRIIDNSSSDDLKREHRFIWESTPGDEEDRYVLLSPMEHLARLTSPEYCKQNGRTFPHTDIALFYVLAKLINALSRQSTELGAEKLGQDVYKMATEDFVAHGPGTLTPKSRLLTPLILGCDISEICFTGFDPVTGRTILHLLAFLPPPFRGPSNLQWEPILKSFKPAKTARAACKVAFSMIVNQIKLQLRKSNKDRISFIDFLNRKDSEGFSALDIAEIYGTSNGDFIELLKSEAAAASTTPGTTRSKLKQAGRKFRAQFGDAPKTKEEDEHLVQVLADGTLTMAVLLGRDPYHRTLDATEITAVNTKAENYIVNYYSRFLPHMDPTKPLTPRSVLREQLCNKGALGFTGLHYAVYERDVELVRKILAMGPRPVIHSMETPVPLMPESDENILITGVQLVCESINIGKRFGPLQDTPLDLAERLPEVPPEIVELIKAELEKRQIIAIKEEPGERRIKAKLGNRINVVSDEPITMEQEKSMKAEPEESKACLWKKYISDKIDRIGSSTASDLIASSQLHGADVNMPDHDVHSPVYEAVDNQDVQFVELLVKHGANLQQQFETNEIRDLLRLDLLNIHSEMSSMQRCWPRIPLYRAIYHDNVDIVKILLQHGAPSQYGGWSILNFASLFAGKTVSSRAVREKHSGPPLKVLSRLLSEGQSFGLDFDAIDPEGISAFFAFLRGIMGNIKVDDSTVEVRKVHCYRPYLDIADLFLAKCSNATLNLNHPLHFLADSVRSGEMEQRELAMQFMKRFEPFFGSRFNMDFINPRDLHAGWSILGYLLNSEPIPCNASNSEQVMPVKENNLVAVKAVFSRIVEEAGRQCDRELRKLRLGAIGTNTDPDHARQANIFSLRDHDGFTPLHLAIIHRNSFFVDILAVHHLVDLSEYPGKNAGEGCFGRRVAGGELLLKDAQLPGVVDIIVRRIRDRSSPASRFAHPGGKLIDERVIHLINNKLLLLESERNETGSADGAVKDEEGHDQATSRRTPSLDSGASGGAEKQIEVEPNEKPSEHGPLPTALHYAIHEHDEDLIRSLLQIKPIVSVDNSKKVAIQYLDLNARFGMLLETPLMLAERLHLSDGIIEALKLAGEHQWSGSEIMALEVDVESVGSKFSTVNEDSEPGEVESDSGRYSGGDTVSGSDPQVLQKLPVAFVDIGVQTDAIFCSEVMQREPDLGDSKDMEEEGQSSSVVFAARRVSLVACLKWMLGRT
ncbi:ankyrin [Ascobolus immersus RN42]|uniref:Ankyrin n=1 Tax=Ascobolus immersus RN42 TaxID=1160509 RepID=A0A3N4IE90_ASCIM|nr:ankyrin [Ascobolus immersus RN42]